MTRRQPMTLELQQHWRKDGEPATAHPEAAADGKPIADPRPKPGS